MTWLVFKNATGGLQFVFEMNAVETVSKYKKCFRKKITLLWISEICTMFPCGIQTPFQTVEVFVKRDSL